MPYPDGNSTALTPATLPRFGTLVGPGLCKRGTQLLRLCRFLVATSTTRSRSSVEMSRRGPASDPPATTRAFAASE